MKSKFEIKTKTKYIQKCPDCGAILTKMEKYKGEWDLVWYISPRAHRLHCPKAKKEGRKDDKKRKRNSR
jgi:hypothetical protein